LTTNYLTESVYNFVYTDFKGTVDSVSFELKTLHRLCKSPKTPFHQSLASYITKGLDRASLRPNQRFEPKDLKFQAHEASVWYFKPLPSAEFLKEIHEATPAATQPEIWNPSVWFIRRKKAFWYHDQRPSRHLTCMLNKIRQKETRIGRRMGWHPHFVSTSLPVWEISSSRAGEHEGKSEHIWMDLALSHCV